MVDRVLYLELIELAVPLFIYINMENKTAVMTKMFIVPNPIIFIIRRSALLNGAPMRLNPIDKALMINCGIRRFLAIFSG